MILIIFDLIIFNEKLMVVVKWVLITIIRKFRANITQVHQERSGFDKISVLWFIKIAYCIKTQLISVQR